ncbi:MAG: fatty acid desaturase, partial [Gammaproteobacteria bacterium]|nr:fatty acid desaturase [Gammaproteobacteria bacterium]
MILDGILDLSGWQIVVWALISCHITLLGVTIYLHRAMAHRALDLHPAVSHFFRFWLWLTTGMVTVQWVAIHRKHHAHCETDEDPHSPQVLGLRRVFFQGAELYQDAAKRPEIMEKYGRGCPNDWLERTVYSRFPWLGISALLVIEFALMGMWGVSVFAVQMMCIPLLAAGVINGVGHYWGYRNYECNDAATNVSPWGIVIVGEELHNNHHAYPSSAKFALRPWEFDLGWMYIRALQAIGLAKVRRVAPAPTVDSAKSQIDIETVKALISSRLHVMQDYASN